MFRQLNSLYKLLSNMQKKIVSYFFVCITLCIMFLLLFNLINYQKTVYRVFNANKQDYFYVNSQAEILNDVLDVNQLLMENSTIKNMIYKRAKKYNILDLDLKNEENKLRLQFNVNSLEDNISFVNDLLGLTQLTMHMLKISQENDLHSITIILN